MGRSLILAAGLLACPIPAGTFAQEYRKTVTLEVCLPEGASVAHGMADVKPDEQIVIDTELGEFDVHLWKAETLRGN
jgi:hypothetical protein